MYWIFYSSTILIASYGFQVFFLLKILLQELEG